MINRNSLIFDFEELAVQCMKEIWPTFKIEADGKSKETNIQISIYLIFVLGDVMFSTRQLVTTSCYMDLHKYPFE